MPVHNIQKYKQASYKHAPQDACKLSETFIYTKETEYFYHLTFTFSPTKCVFFACMYASGRKHTSENISKLEIRATH